MSPVAVKGILYCWLAREALSTDAIQQKVKFQYTSLLFLASSLNGNVNQQLHVRMALTLQ